MTDAAPHDAWQAGDSYDLYMGRWSRQIAPQFLQWLSAPAGADWLDVGCGTGALSAAILSSCAPHGLVAVDPSAGFLEKARANVTDPRIEFSTADAQSLPIETASKDVVVSGLVLNFVPDRAKALAEMRRVARPGGTIAFYVWDYPGGGVEFMHVFWVAAEAIDARAAGLNEARRFAFCTADALRREMRDAGFATAEVEAIEAPAVFADFADFWRPFTLGAGPAPSYCASLDPAVREALRSNLDEALPRRADGSIATTLRAWAVRAAV
ncbi:MAG: class I SAM-dependent methyltransferase [Hyphomicrobiaceae bacterium]